MPKRGVVKDAPVMLSSQYEAFECKTCEGVGYVLSRRGLMTVKIQCPWCAGSGYIYKEKPDE